VLVEPWKDWYTSHFWSQGVEEHFYLLLPGLLVLVRRRRALVLGMMALMVVAWRSYYVSSFQLSPEQHTDTVIDALLIPAIGQNSTVPTQPTVNHGLRLCQLLLTGASPRKI
jgi:peptidoglycan/LPS O-acetylase OafA/YrhL